MRTVDNFWTIFSGNFIVDIWARLWSPDKTNRIKWRLKIVVQVRPFSSALPVADGVGTKNVTTVSIVRVGRNNHMNGIRQKSSLSIDLLPVCSEPDIFMCHHLMHHQMHRSWLCWRGDFPLRMTTWLGLRGRSWVFSTMISYNIFSGGSLGIGCFAFCGSPILLISLLSGITIYFPLLSLLLVMGHGHIHSKLDSISVLAVVLLAPKNLFLSVLDFSFPVCSKVHLARPLGFLLVVPWVFLWAGLLDISFLMEVAKAMIVDLALFICAS